MNRAPTIGPRSIVRRIRERLFLRGARQALRRVELYQPLYGISFRGGVPARDCRDRWRTIEAVFDRTDFNWKDAKVLDIGSSLGFFSFSAANKGALVDAFDVNADNVEISNRIRRYHGLKEAVRFNASPVLLENIPTLQAKGLMKGHYDVVFLMSVIHHVVHERGIEYGKSFMSSLSAMADYVVIELALSSEPLYWAENQPADPTTLLEKQFRCGYSCVDFAATHLSDERRPIFLCRNKPLVYCIDHGHDELKFNEIFLSPAEGCSRPWGARYYRNSSHFLKLYDRRHDSDDPVRAGNYEKQFLNEIEVLTKLGQQVRALGAPELISAATDRDGVTTALYKRIEGSNLSDWLRKTGVRDTGTLDTIIRSQLSLLAELERLGYWHNDVRLWNFMISEHQDVSLIDFGTASRTDEDNVRGTNAERFLDTIYCMLAGTRQETHKFGDIDLRTMARYQDLAEAVQAGESSFVKLQQLLGDPSRG
jgi:O-antigen chain-terminating methyltransferase